MTNEAKDLVFADIERELAVTRKILAAVPIGHSGWKPHDKSMTLEQLAIHVADLPGWARAALAGDELNFQTTERPPRSVASIDQLLSFFDARAAALRHAIQQFDMARWNGAWTMRNGSHVLTTQPRPTVFRIWSLNHLVHHRAQLCIYLRLLNVPVPTVYFNTADDPAWVFE
jgi:uncharacterized damage-inducible protein DinB